MPYGSILHIPLTNLPLLAAKHEKVELKNIKERQELVPSVLSLSKKHVTVRLGHAVIMDHSIYLSISGFKEAYNFIFKGNRQKQFF